MSFATERFTTEEMSKPRHSPKLAALLADYLNYHTTAPIYDFGCGDGFYLHHISNKVGHQRKCVGIEGALKVPNAYHDKIKHPVDVASPLHLEGKGDVISIEVAEHIHSDRLGGFLANIDKYCGNHLILTWALRGQGGIRHVSCRNEDEVMRMLLPLGFEYNPTKSEQWRNEAGQDLWWFKRSIYIFKRKRS